VRRVPPGRTVPDRRRAAPWSRIVENMAALVGELDRSFVREIEEAAGPSPEWYRPES